MLFLSRISEAWSGQDVSEMQHSGPARQGKGFKWMTSSWMRKSSSSFECQSRKGHNYEQNEWRTHQCLFSLPVNLCRAIVCLKHSPSFSTVRLDSSTASRFEMSGLRRYSWFVPLPLPTRCLPVQLDKRSGLPTPLSWIVGGNAAKGWLK